MHNVFARKNGFTIVELLIVIVVIGILTAIIIVAFSGMQTRAQNVSASQELKNWQKLFESYRAFEGRYPDMADGGYCLGTGFPNGTGGVARCRNYLISSYNYLESDNSALMSEIRKVGSIPNSPKYTVKGTNVTVGPWVVYNASAIELMTVLKADAGVPCPSGFIANSTPGDGRLECKVVLNK